MDKDNGRFTVTTRIFDIISDLAPDKQFSLYEQLAGDKIKDELFKLIIDMSEDDKTRLLRQLESISYDYEPPLNTLNLDEEASLMRGKSRKICELKATCVVADLSFQSCITDISQVGAFIESNDRFLVGQKVELTFNIPGCPEEFRLNGHVARSGPRGFGVKFEELKSDQADTILTYLDSKK